MARPAHDTRDRITAATLRLLREGGLSAAGLAEIVALAQAPRGSLYHHFPRGKAQMVAEALEVYRDSVAGQLAGALQGDGPVRDRVGRVFDAVERRLAAVAYSRSCAVGAVVLDLSAHDAALRAQCDAILAHWATVAAQHLPELPAAERERAGRLLVMLLEGAQLAARAAGHGGPLREAARAFAALVDPTPAGTPT